MPYATAPDLAWDDLAVADDVNDPNGGALAAIAGSLGEVKQVLSNVEKEQRDQRDLLTRFDERQRSWATKHELTEVRSQLMAEQTLTAQKADAAHRRMDEHKGAMTVLADALKELQGSVEAIRDGMERREAEVRGAWAVVRPGAAWLMGILGVVVAAFTAGHFVT